jgi:potassium/hydrogen antiporter
VETAAIMLFLGALVFLAHLFVGVFQRTRVPDDFFLILIGFVIGPLLHLVMPQDFGKLGPVFQTVALVVILFEAGLEIRLEHLRDGLRDTLLITLGSYFGAWLLLTAGIRWLTDLSWPLSLFSGALLAGPAPSVVVPLARQLGLRDRSRTTLTLESAIGEALCILVSLAILDATRDQSVAPGRVVGSLLSSFVLAVMLGGAGGYLWSILLNKTRKLQNAIFTTPSFVFVIYGLTEVLGFSGPVAVLTFAIMIENVELIYHPWLTRLTRKKHFEPIMLDNLEKLFFGEIVFLLKTFFFVFLGLSLGVFSIEVARLALLLLVLLLAVRMLAVRFCVAKGSTTRRDAALIAVMIPRGLATAVLASAPLYRKMENGLEVQEIIYTVISISIVATTLLIFLLEKTGFGASFRRLYGDYLPDDPPAEAPAAQPAVSSSAV